MGFNRRKQKMKRSRDDQPQKPYESLVKENEKFDKYYKVRSRCLLCRNDLRWKTCLQVYCGDG